MSDTCFRSGMYSTSRNFGDGDGDGDGDDGGDDDGDDVDDDDYDEDDDDIRGDGVEDGPSRRRDCCWLWTNVMKI